MYYDGWLDLNRASRSHYFVFVLIPSRERRHCTGVYFLAASTLKAMCCFGKQCSNLEYSKKYLGIAKIYMMEKIIFCKMRATTYESRLTGVIVQLQS